MSFFANQSISVNQRRNPRLNEYFAVVGLPDGPLVLADAPPSADGAPAGGDGAASVAMPVAPTVSAAAAVAPVVAVAAAAAVVASSAARHAEGRSGSGVIDVCDGDVNGTNGNDSVNPVADTEAATTAARAVGGEDALTVAEGTPNVTTNASLTAPLTAATSTASVTEDKRVVGQRERSVSPPRATATATTTTAVTQTSPTPPPGAPSAAPVLLRRPSLPRRRSYGSCELGMVRTRPERDGADGGGPLYARFRSRVLHRFPAYEHEGSAFPANLPLFCLPGGLKISLDMKLPTFFAFVHTRANGQHMFGYCLCLYEPLESRHRSDLQRLVDDHDAKRRARRDSATRDGEAVLPEGTGAAAFAQESTNTAQGALEATLDAAREVYAPKCLCLLSTWPYFGPFREWFLNLYRISLSPFQIPLERYIGNFLLEVPTPSPGRSEVLYNMGNTTISFACPPPNKPVAWGCVPFEPLFQCLSHGNILTVFSCLLLERSLLLKSSQLSLLTSCAEVLALLLYPFGWSHVYIPVLPEALLGVLAAPMPFLIGVHRSFLEGTGMDVASYVVQVDLDNDVVEMGMHNSPLPAFPLKRKTKLLAKLGQHAQLSHCRTPEFREEVMQKSDLAFSMAVRPCDFDEDQLETPPPDWEAVREAFLRFFVALLSGYRRYLIYPTKVNPNPPRLFNVDDYLDKLERDSRPFAEAMCDTQAFQNFVDARIQPEADDLDIRFFDASITAKRNRSMLHVIKKDANFLRPEQFVKAKTVYALTPDTSGLDMTAPAEKHDRFPPLSAALYPIPRNIPSLSHPTDHRPHVEDKGSRGGGGFSSIRGGGGGNGGGGGLNFFGTKYGNVKYGNGENAGRVNGDGDGVGGGRRGSLGRGLRMGSSRGDDDWTPLSAEATVFAVFIVGFCATIGVDPRPERPAGEYAPPSTPTSSGSQSAGTASGGAGGAGAAVGGDERKSSPADEVSLDPSRKADEAAPVSVKNVNISGPGLASSTPTEATTTRKVMPISEGGDQGSDSSWGSGPATAPASSDAGGALSTARAAAAAGVGIVQQQVAVLTAGRHGTAPSSSTSSVGVVDDSNDQSSRIDSTRVEGGTERDEDAGSTMVVASSGMTGVAAIPIPAPSARPSTDMSAEMASAITQGTSTSPASAGAGNSAPSSSVVEAWDEVSSRSHRSSLSSSTVLRSSYSSATTDAIDCTQKQRGGFAGTSAAPDTTAAAEVALAAIPRPAERPSAGAAQTATVGEGVAASDDAEGDVKPPSFSVGEREQDAAMPLEIPDAEGGTGNPGSSNSDFGRRDGRSGADGVDPTQRSSEAARDFSAAPNAKTTFLSDTSVSGIARDVTDATQDRKNIEAASSTTAVGGEDERGVAASERKSSRLAFSELNLDLKEERLYRANEALMVAFEALDAMREKAPVGEEAVYRSLISACGRCGNSEKALSVVEMMMSTGIIPDAMVSRCLVDAFAMDDSFSDGGAHPLSLLDWSKFRPKNRDGRKSHEPHGNRTDTPFSLRKMMKRFERSESPAPTTPRQLGPSPSTKAKAAAIVPAGVGGDVGEAGGGGATLRHFTPKTLNTPSRPRSNASFMGLSVSAPGTGETARSKLRRVGGTGASRNNSVDQEQDLEVMFSTARESFDSPSRPFSRGRVSLEEGSDEEQSRSSALRKRLERGISPYSARGGMSSAMQQQVLLGEKMLERLFPDLKIDNSSETCPACHSELSSAQVRAGWSSDPNDYTTECRALVDLHAATPGTVAAAGMGWADAGNDKGTIGGGGGATAIASAASSTTWSGTTFESSKPAGTPLWCEYLSPWVLRKEFHTVLSAYGLQYLCSSRFQEGLGPIEDDLVGGRFSSGGEGRGRREGGGADSSRSSRSVDRTVFWNLVVHFQEQCLPVTFLLSEIANGGA